MKLGFDLDKIFVNHPPLVPEGVIDKLYIKKANETLEYRMPSVPEQYIRRLSHLSFLRPVMKENLTFLRAIPRKNNDLFLISSRFGFLEDKTKSLIKKYELNELFDGLYFNFKNEQPHIFKNSILQKLKLDIYVDDDPYLLKYLAKHNKDTKFFWLNHHQGPIPKFKNLTAISHLPDIFK